MAGELSGGRESSNVCHASFRLGLWTTLQQIVRVISILIYPHPLLEQKCTDVPSSHESESESLPDPCSSDRVLFGAKKLGTTTLTLAAMGSTRTTEVVNPTVAVQNPITLGVSNGTKLHNGVYWYQSAEAFGFSPVPEIALTVIDKVRGVVSTFECSGDRQHVSPDDDEPYFRRLRRTAVDG